MKLTEIEKVSAAKLNAKMQAQLGWNIKLESLSVPQAHGLMESVDVKLDAIRKSSEFHTSEKDPKYTGLLMAKQVLETFVFEAGKKSEKAKKLVKDDKLVKKNDKKIDESESTISVSDLDALKGMKDVNQAKQMATQLIARSRTQPEKKSRLSRNIQNCRSLTDVLSLMYNTFLNGERLGVSNSSWNQKLGNNSPVRAESKENAGKLTEDQISQAESTMAARDMVDSVQDMLEDISKMLNENLPPLVDSIRGNIGVQQADAFKNAASSALQSLLTACQSTRESIDSAVRGLTGEGAAPAAMGMPNDPMAGGMGADPGMDMNLDLEDPLGDDFGASDAAVGGELPMGREKRM